MLRPPSPAGTASPSRGTSRRPWLTPLVAAHSLVERAEAHVPVGLERAHPELLSQRVRLAVIGLGLFRVGPVGRGGFAKEPQRVCLVSRRLMLAPRCTLPA